MSTIAMIT